MNGHPVKLHDLDGDEDGEGEEAEERGEDLEGGEAQPT